MKVSEVDLEAEYREKFENLKTELHSTLKSFLAESIVNNSYESPELKAQVSLYKPIVESIVKSLKENGILNSNQQNDEDIPEEVVKVITEQTELINNQSKKIKELKMRVKLHEMISSNLSGLSKDIIREAINKFQGEDEMPEDELIKKLTKFVNTRKPNTKTIQFESVESIDSDINELEDIMKSDDFRPSKKINIPGIKPRTINEASGFNHSESQDDDLDPASQFMRDFGHL